MKRRAPNAEESARIVAVKVGPCVACMVRHQQGEWPHSYLPMLGCDYHHLLSGGRRIGHMAGIGLCAWHHRAVPDWGCSPAEMRLAYGPSLMDGSRLFREAYGSDEELMELQDELLRVAA